MYKVYLYNSASNAESDSYCDMEKFDEETSAYEFKTKMCDRGYSVTIYFNGECMQSFAPVDQI